MKKVLLWYFSVSIHEYLSPIILLMQCARISPNTLHHPY